MMLAILIGCGSGDATVGVITPVRHCAYFDGVTESCVSCEGDTCSPTPTLFRAPDECDDAGRCFPCTGEYLPDGGTEIVCQNQ
jgi:hypothetical protein